MADFKKQNDESAQTGVPIILIDNNMIQHFLSKEYGKQLETILKEIAAIGATLAVSQIVVYEALKAIVFNEDKFTEVSNFFEQYILRFPVDENVLIESARVHEIYGMDKNTKGHRDSFSTEDIIIATTSMLQGAYIMTCDANDFPMPFFKENNRRYVYYEQKGRRKHLIIYLLEPDNEAITAALNMLNPANPEKK
ncbi:MAG TPA: hypothetical protein VLG92_01565 [Candidatus Saccharimonadia bacterium]|nr:hypothetical protein [Candidatus Saccharimonadia bacterium]